jgi:hypothetical protein
MASIPSGTFGQALKSGEWSDFRIQCHQYQFSVHRVVLCSASPWFARMCSSRFKEKEDGFVSLPEHRPATIARVLAYIYTGDYSMSVDIDDFNVQRLSVTSLAGTAVEDDSAEEEDLNSHLPCTPPTDATTKLIVHTLVYKAADFLDLPDLKKHARNKFSSDFKDHDYQALPQLARLVYESTQPDDELRRYFSEQVITNHVSSSEDADLVRVMRQFEPTAWILGLANHGKLTDLQHDREELKQQLKSKTSEIAALDSRVSELRVSEMVTRTNFQRYMDAQRCSSLAAQRTAGLIKYCPSCAQQVSPVVKKKHIYGVSPDYENKCEISCMACQKKWSIDPA